MQAPCWAKGSALLLPPRLWPGNSGRVQGQGAWRGCSMGPESRGAGGSVWGLRAGAPSGTVVPPGAMSQLPPKTLSLRRVGAVGLRPHPRAPATHPPRRGTVPSRACGAWRLGSAPQARTAPCCAPGRASCLAWAPLEEFPARAKSASIRERARARESPAWQLSKSRAFSTSAVGSYLCKSQGPRGRAPPAPGGDSSSPASEPAAQVCSPLPGSDGEARKRLARERTVASQSLTGPLAAQVLSACPPPRAMGPH
ncbi:unnamed protein product [Eretmochelys imbricata]